jgi:lactoylglutathione lyase
LTRDIQKHLKTEGIKMLTEADEEFDGPAHFVIEDADGNQILVDQHRGKKMKKGELQ